MSKADDIEVINGYKPCKSYEACKKYDMLICCDCPHGIKIRRDNINVRGRKKSNRIS